MKKIMKHFSYFLGLFLIKIKNDPSGGPNCIRMGTFFLSFLVKSNNYSSVLTLNKLKLFKMGG